MTQKNKHRYGQAAEEVERMTHYLNVCNIDGREVEPVDIVTFGSPCQDLSVAGKRAGLKHEANGDEETTRSGLFMEAVRIIKEMREATDGRYPTFAFWENVPGAFSSNKGEDFRIVLEELIKIVEPEIPSLPPVGKNGWPYADCIVGDGWNIAYRVFDAQYWGVPQRRRRIALVADFAGQRAEEILFERESLPRDSETRRTTRKTASADAERSARADDCTRNCLTPWDVQSRRIFTSDGKWPSLYGGEGGGHGYCMMLCIAYSFDSLASNSMKSSNPHSGCRKVEIAKTLDCFDPSPAKNQGGIAVLQPIMCYSAGFKAGQGAKARSIGWEGEVSPSLAAEAGGNSVPSVCVKETLPFDTTQITSPQNECNPKWGDQCHPLAAQGHPPCVVIEQHLFENHSQDARYKDPLSICPMLSAQLGTGGNNQPLVVEEKPVFCLQGNGIDRADTARCNGKGWKEDTSYTLTTIDRHAMAYAMQGFGDYKESEQASGLKARDYKDATDLVAEYIDITHADDVVRTDNIVSPLQARDYKGGKLVRIRYVVRRLTPTECARLQGFPDCWGYIDHKDDFTDEEYRFWLDVRNTHASINGKTVKEYTKAQMLTWYNKLHTDSAEYKMWGNGVALPFVRFPMSRMAALGAKTLGSLFDGSGGFPLAGALEGITPLWASEIEPYPIAVTVSRFK